MAPIHGHYELELITLFCLLLCHVWLEAWALVVSGKCSIAWKYNTRYTVCTSESEIKYMVCTGENEINIQSVLVKLWSVYCLYRNHKVRKHLRFAGGVSKGQKLMQLSRVCALIGEMFTLTILLFSGRHITISKTDTLWNDWLEKIGEHKPVSLSILKCRGEKVTRDGLRGLFRACADSLQVKYSTK